MDQKQDDSTPVRFNYVGGALYKQLMTTPTTHEAAPRGKILRPQLTLQLLCFNRVPTETARLLKDVVFRVGARLGKIRREKLEKASPSRREPSQVQMNFRTIHRRNETRIHERGGG
jgi:hypothetical protein